MERYFKESIELHTAISRDEDMLNALRESVDLIVGCFKRGNKLLIAGNGGSAADAQHFAAEMVGKFLAERKALPALALTVDTSMLTAWSNDVSFDTVFARQLEAHGRPGDVFFGISTSGKSRNLIEALGTAKSLDMKTIGLLGKGGGAMKDLCDLALVIPSDSVPRIQEVHEMFFHIICEEVERAMALETRFRLKDENALHHVLP
jgi:D-sedoheptulose 7-phosphate isomerase